MKLSDLKQGSYTTKTEDQSPGYLMGAVNTLGNFGAGVGSEIINSLSNLGKLPLKGASYLTEKAGAPRLSKALQPPEGPSPLTQIPEIKKRADTFAGKAGQFAGMAAEFLLPTGGVTRGQKILSTAFEKAPKGTQLISKMLAKAGPEGAADFGVEYLRTGGDVESAKEQALFGAGMVGSLNILGNVVRASYWPELQSSVTKALGISGKSSAGRVAGEIEKKISGFATLKEMAPNTKIVDINGSTKIFDPKKATYHDTVQALANNKNSLFEQYSALAKQAGEKATIDITEVVKNLGAITEQARTADIKSAARNILNDIYDNFMIKLPDGSVMVKEADVSRLQTFLQDLNNGAALTLAGKSDKAYGEVAADTAGRLRQLMEDTITSKTGSSYQAIRSKYASLKAIEDDLVRKFKQDARKIGGGLTDYVYIMNTPELIASAMTLNPALFTGTAASSIFAAMRKYLSAPERFLQRSFNLVDSKGASDLSVRLFGGMNNTPLSESERKFVDYIKNIQPGLSTKNVVKSNITQDIHHEIQGLIDRNRLDEAKKIFNTLPEGDKYKQGMQSFFDKYQPEVVAKQEANKKALDNFLSKWTQRDTDELSPNLTEDMLKKIEEATKDLPKPTKPVTLYRGTSEGEKSVLTHPSSWTYNKEAAMDHAELKGGKVIRKKVNPDEILIDSTDLPQEMKDRYQFIDEEEEVILKPMKGDLKGKGTIPQIEDSLIQEARKYKTAEEFVNSIEKTPLQNGIDKKNLSSAYKIGENQYVLAKKTGNDILPNGRIVPTNKTTFFADGRKSEFEYRIVNFDPQNDPNLYNAYLRAKNGTNDLENIKSQLIDIWKKANNSGKTTTGTLLGGAAATGVMAMGMNTEKKIDVDLEGARNFEKSAKDLGYDVTQEGDELIASKKHNLDQNKLKEGFVQSENRGAVAQGKDPYQEVGVTGDLGKYQASPETLKTWSKGWLGKEYSSEEFLKDPQAQEVFMEEFLAVVDRYKLTPEQAAIAWHKGFGPIGSNKSFEDKRKELIDQIEKFKDDPKVQKYLKEFLIGYNKNNGNN